MITRVSATLIAVLLVGVLFTGGCSSSPGGVAPVQFVGGPSTKPAGDAAKAHLVRDGDDHASWYQSLTH